MAKRQRELVTHTFKGPRFEDHGLDLDVLPDLLAYKTILVETAKELWRRRHPDRQRLPKGFEDSLKLKFYELRPGSTAVPLVREIECENNEAQLKLFEPPPDELDEAVQLVADTIDAAANDQPFPDDLPASVTPLFANYGKTLREDEFFEHNIPDRPAVTRYTVAVRDKLSRSSQEPYEDAIELVGEVRAADLDGTSFWLRLDNGTKVPGRFEPDQEAIVVEALHEHATRRLRIIGRAEFDPATGSLKRITAVDHLAIQMLAEQPVDTSARPIWEIAVEIGATVPEEEWADEPPDVSKRLDHYLYGSGEGGE
ncbi:MAG: hypothetical protein GXP27_20025 [Planctomycetes bacterium]|nr:hypothetical protein [Planctomycetota bacterium]